MLVSRLAGEVMSVSHLEGETTRVSPPEEETTQVSRPEGETTLASHPEGETTPVSRPEEETTVVIHPEGEATGGMTIATMDMGIIATMDSDFTLDSRIQFRTTTIPTLITRLRQWFLPSLRYT